MDGVVVPREFDRVSLRGPFYTRLRWIEARSRSFNVSMTNFSLRPAQPRTLFCRYTEWQIPPKI